MRRGKGCVVGSGVDVKNVTERGSAKTDARNIYFFLLCVEKATQQHCSRMLTSGAVVSDKKHSASGSGPLSALWMSTGSAEALR